MSKPYVLFCADPLSPRKIDPTFAQDAKAASDAGVTCITLDHDYLDRRIDAIAALRKTSLNEPGKAVYRGWMLRSEAYEALFHALLKRQVQMITSPAEYSACHHAPGSYARLKHWMAETSWVSLNCIHDSQAIQEGLAVHGHSAVIVKDWVKSQANGYWNEACYIPDASEQKQADRVIARFLELQGDSLVGGLVFKRYIPLTPAGAPAYECRAFVVNGRVVGCWPRSQTIAQPLLPPGELLEEIAASIPSPFASADLGIDIHGKWWLLEVGDGQVSGLPSTDAAVPVMTALADALDPGATVPA